MTKREIFIMIGNSDDKLTQQEWSDFVIHVDILLRPRGSKGDADYDPDYPVKARHGNWRSQPDDPWQNACWCVEIEDDAEATGYVWHELSDLARAFRQDSIAWAEASTEFIKAAS